MMSDETLLDKIMPKYYARDDSLKLPQDLHEKVSDVNLLLLIYFKKLLLYEIIIKF